MEVLILPNQSQIENPPPMYNNGTFTVVEND
jgi:hypothetical protein